MEKDRRKRLRETSYMFGYLVNRCRVPVCACERTTGDVFYGGLLAPKAHNWNYVHITVIMSTYLLCSHNCNYVHVIVINNYVPLAHKVNGIRASKAHTCICIYLYITANQLYIIAVYLCIIYNLFNIPVHSLSSFANPVL